MTDMESRRLNLYNRLQEVLGADPATTLMTHLPPVSAQDLLTNREFANFKAEFVEFKAEFAEFRTDVRKRFDQIDGKFDHVNKRIDRVLLAVVGGLFVVVAAFVGLTVL